MKNIKFDYDDILIEPAETSEILSRDEINPYVKSKILPIFTAPMFDVVSNKNYHLYEKNGIIPILPRGKRTNIFDIEDEGWFALSLEEFKNDYITNKKILQHKERVLIDMANGHLTELENVVKEAKEIYKDDLILMVGNIANPWTYERLSDAGADFIRCGIGNGSVCLTSENIGVGSPMASLIKECYDIFCTKEKSAKIVADGGMKKYADVIKSLAIGADMVMIGGIFNKTLESSADTFLGNKKYTTWTEPGDKIDQYDPKYAEMFKAGTKFYKKFRGMSTKEVQKELGKTDIRTSEGIIKLNEVEYTLEQWVENFTDYLKSAMSYTNAKTLDDFIGKPKINFITQNALNRFKK